MISLPISLKAEKGHTATTNRAQIPIKGHEAKKENVINQTESPHLVFLLLLLSLQIMFIGDVLQMGHGR